MFLDAKSARDLSALLIANNQGTETLRSQLPLDVVEQDRTWLTKGRSFKDETKGLNFCMSHVILSKTDAEVIDIGLTGRMLLTPAQKTYWENHMSKEDFKRVFGPRTNFDLSTLGSTAYMDVNKALRGGLVNTSEMVIDYACVLIRLVSQSSTIEQRHLKAIEIEGAWHVATEGSGNSKLILCISRQTGKILYNSIDIII